MTRRKRKVGPRHVRRTELRWWGATSVLTMSNAFVAGLIAAEIAGGVL